MYNTMLLLREISAVKLSIFVEEDMKTVYRSKRSEQATSEFGVNSTDIVLVLQLLEILHSSREDVVKTVDHRSID